MKYINYFILIWCLFCSCLVKSKHGNIKNMNEINESIEIVFYYNPVVYTEFQTEGAVKNGSYELKRTFLYNELSEITNISDVLHEQPIFLDDSEKELAYKNLVECLCIVYSDEKTVLTFTYSENPNHDYALCNGKLIKRNDVYDKFAEEIIKIIKNKKQL